MVYGYTRVSTEKQITSTQRSAINKYCKQMDMKVDVWIDETVSGRKSIEDRKFNIIMKKAKKGDIIIVTETSRIGRTMKIISKVMFDCIDRGIIIHAIKEHHIIGSDNPQAKLVMEIFSFAAEVERNLIVARTKEALEERKRMGVILGRPVGAKNRSYRLDSKREYIEEQLKKGTSKAKIARRCGVNKTTLYAYIKNKMPEVATGYIGKPII